MPIYEYECAACGHRFELRQGFHEEPADACPQCQGKAHRVIHSVPVVFKGSGFYVNDYRKDGGRDYGGDREDKIDKAKGTKEEGSAKAESKAQP
ncbi:MAG: zinc ribbon domain-containing protein [Chloroflexi bacterium]|nr:zinc ribbon domain-containing protein [Chloroflexota bacterium]